MQDDQIIVIADGVAYSITISTKELFEALAKVKMPFEMDLLNNGQRLN